MTVTTVTQFGQVYFDACAAVHIIERQPIIFNINTMHDELVYHLVNKLCINSLSLCFPSLPVFPRLFGEVGVVDLNRRAEPVMRRLGVPIVRAYDLTKEQLWATPARDGR